MQKVVSTVAVLLLLWALRFGYNVITAGSEDYATDTDDRGWIAEEVQWVEQEVSSGAAEPARGWLRAPNHGTFEAPPQQLNQLIEDFHAAGADKVWMVGIESLGNNRLADVIAVELPSDPAGRARIFAVEAALHGEYAEDFATPDIGQRYLTVSYD